jgi:hypothetical protein
MRCNIDILLFQGHTWTCEVDMIRPSVYADLTGIHNTPFDVGTGRASFYNMSVTGYGLYFLQITVVSNPQEYILTYNWRVQIKDPRLVNMTVEETSLVQVNQ